MKQGDMVRLKKTYKGDMIKCDDLLIIVEVKKEYPGREDLGRVIYAVNPASDTWQHYYESDLEVVGEVEAR